MSSTNSWHPAYFTTRFRVERAEPWLASDFAIITACATTGEVWTAQREAEADRALKDVLLDAGALGGRITGYDPATGHAEPGWAALLPVDEAVRIGRTFAQDAIFVVHDGDVWLHCCHGRRDTVRVGRFAERLEVEEHAHRSAQVEGRVPSRNADQDVPSEEASAWQLLITVLTELGTTEAGQLPDALVGGEPIFRRLLTHESRLDQFVREATASELAALIRGIVWYGRLGGDTGGSVSPVIRLFAIFRSRFSREESDTLSRWVVAHRANPYEPYGSAMYGTYDTADAYDAARSARRARAAHNSAREALRQRESAALMREHDAELATARLRGAVERGDLAAVEALLARGARWQRVVADHGSLQALARAHGRDTMLQLLAYRGIP